MKISSTILEFSYLSKRTEKWEESRAEKLTEKRKDKCFSFKNITGERKTAKDERSCSVHVRRMR